MLLSDHVFFFIKIEKSFGRWPDYFLTEIADSSDLNFDFFYNTHTLNTLIDYTPHAHTQFSAKSYSGP